jgi:hypothetical protein
LSGRHEGVPSWHDNLLRRDFKVRRATGILIFTLVSECSALLGDMTHLRVSARAGSAWRPCRCGAASPRSTRAVAWPPACPPTRALPAVPPRRRERPLPVALHHLVGDGCPPFEIRDEPLAVWLQGHESNSRGAHPVSPNLFSPIGMSRITFGVLDNIRARTGAVWNPVPPVGRV